MKLLSVVALCLAVAAFSTVSADGRSSIPVPKCFPIPSGKFCPRCAPFFRCCGVRTTVCNKVCTKDVCIAPSGAVSAPVSRCPTKIKCTVVPVSACKDSKTCRCSVASPSECKPNCKIISKGPCTGDKCDKKPIEVCDPPISCIKCTRCVPVPECGPRCGTGYCLPGSRCNPASCSDVCKPVIVPRCVRTRRVLPGGDDDDNGGGKGGDDDDDNGGGKGGDDDDDNGGGKGGDDDDDDGGKKGRKHHGDD